MESLSIMIVKLAFCANSRIRCHVSVLRTNGPLVIMCISKYFHTIIIFLPKCSSGMTLKATRTLFIVIGAQHRANTTIMVTNILITCNTKSVKDSN